MRIGGANWKRCNQLEIGSSLLAPRERNLYCRGKEKRETARSFRRRRFRSQIETQIKNREGGGEELENGHETGRCRLSRPTLSN